jgi:hypothetical protein
MCASRLYCPLSIRQLIFFTLKGTQSHHFINFRSTGFVLSLRHSKQTLHVICFHNAFEILKKFKSLCTSVCLCHQFVKHGNCKTTYNKVLLYISLFQYAYVCNRLRE